MSIAKENYKVYMHRFPNGKVYIGITSRKRACERWNGGHGYKHQALMWNAIQKYGWKNIQHIILAEGLSKEEAERAEVEAIAKHQSTNTSFGYNVDNGGTSPGRMSEQTKEKLRRAQSGEGNSFYGKHLSEEHKNRIRETRKELNIQPRNKQAVRCIETGVVYESTAQATRELGIHNYAIRRVCYGQRKTAGGFHWEYVSA